MINKFLSWLSSQFFNIIADPNDNSITLNKWLYRDMVGSLASAKVFVFSIPDTAEYGFIVNPNFDQPTQLADIQYNTKYHCIGFESLNPTVNRIFYDYRLPDVRCRMAVAKRWLPLRQ